MEDFDPGICQDDIVSTLRCHRNADALRLQKSGQPSACGDNDGHARDFMEPSHHEDRRTHDWRCNLVACAGRRFHAAREMAQIAHPLHVGARQ